MARSIVRGQKYPVTRPCIRLQMSTTTTYTNMKTKLEKIYIHTVYIIHLHKYMRYSAGRYRVKLRGTRLLCGCPGIFVLQYLPSLVARTSIIPASQESKCVAYYRNISQTVIGQTDNEVHLQLVDRDQVSQIVRIIPPQSVIVLPYHAVSAWACSFFARYYGSSH